LAGRGETLEVEDDVIYLEDESDVLRWDIIDVMAPFPLAHSDTASRACRMYATVAV
jgi:hypothetical protein